MVTKLSEITVPTGTAHGENLGDGNYWDAEEGTPTRINPLLRPEVRKRANELMEAFTAAIESTVGREKELPLSVLGARQSLEGLLNEERITEAEDFVREEEVKLRKFA